MEKIQQLLNEHKDKLWGGLYDIQLSNYNSTDIGLREDVEGDIGNFVRMQSLSDLLFNTPFLSWLEWGKIDWSDYQYQKTNLHEMYLPNVSDYHKINLCLLSTDEERIKYVEQYVL